MATALVVGGTGMLAGCVRQLADRGWKVLVPSRNSAGGGPGIRFVADWSEPSEFGARIAARAHEKPRLVVAWIHSPWRRPALTALASHLDAEATVVEVLSSTTADPSRRLPPCILPSSQQVVLGFKRTSEGSRWLTHREISDGVSEVVLEALRGNRPGVQVVGEVRPWSARP